MGIVDQSRMRRARVGACCAACEKDEKPDVGMVVVRSNPGSHGGYGGGYAAAGPRYSNTTVDWLHPDWMRATFYDAPPSPTSRRWIKLVRPYTGIAAPGSKLYEAILFKRSGAEQHAVIVQVRGTGSTLQAAVFVPGGPGPDSMPLPNPARRTTAGVQEFALAAAVPTPGNMPLGLLSPAMAAIDQCANGWCRIEKVSAAGRAYARNKLKSTAQASGECWYYTHNGQLWFCCPEPTGCVPLPVTSGGPAGRRHGGAGLAAGVVTAAGRRPPSQGFVVVSANSPAGANRRAAIRSITPLLPNLGGSQETTQHMMGFPATRRRNSRGSAGSFSGGGFRQGGM